MNKHIKNFQDRICPICLKRIVKLSGRAWKQNIVLPFYYCVSCNKIFKMSFKEIKPEVKT